MKTREIPQNYKAVAPVTALYNTMKSQEARREADRATADADLCEMETLIKQVAMAVYHFRHHLPDLPGGAARSFAALEDVLAGRGVQIIDYTGRPVDDQLLQAVEIEGWDTGTEPVELVNETFAPEIRWRGHLLQTAQVFCLRAAPPSPEAPASQRDEPGEASQAIAAPAQGEKEQETSPTAAPKTEKAEPVPEAKEAERATDNEKPEPVPDDKKAETAPSGEKAKSAPDAEKTEPVPEDEKATPVPGEPENPREGNPLKPWYKQLWAWLTRGK